MKSTYKPSLKKIKKAASKLKQVVVETPFTKNVNYSKQYDASIYFKREDLQLVRSYKIRGAFNKMCSLSPEEKQKGVVCASAGNHAQGVAFACSYLKIKGHIYMPSPTPKQKIEQVNMFGEGYVEVILTGDTFDDAYAQAKKVCKKLNKVFIHPFDDKKIIEGQATVALEILKQTYHPIDYLFLPVGGGGLAAGVSSVFKLLSPKTRIVGVEPEGAQSMKAAFEKGSNVMLKNINKFVDGAAVKQVGSLTYNICKETLDEVTSVSEGCVCQTILDLYNRQAIVVEPAGALTTAVLSKYANEIKGKRVVCLISGSNNDITRMAEIKERALLHERLKHYFIVNFPQRSGALKEFVQDVLGKDDDITFFEYSKKTNRENGPAVVGVELKEEKDFQPLVERMKKRSFYGEYLNDKPKLFEYLF